MLTPKFGSYTNSLPSFYKLGQLIDHNSQLNAKR